MSALGRKRTIVALIFCLVSGQLLDEVFCLKVRVAFKHFQRLVAAYCGDLHDAQATFEKPSRRFVSQVVEANDFLPLAFSSFY